VNADPFLMAVAVGASCAFLTPIGHQNNTLVMGPGGYRFTDYWRVGLPLDIIIVSVAVPLIPRVWPL
jgi:di/tricarboxylate transporter